MAKMPRATAIVLPLLRVGLTDQEHPVKVGSWVENIDFRHFPMINVRRLGGGRDPRRPTVLGRPVIEMTAYGDEGLPETEQLYEDALDVLYEAVRRQTQTDAGYLHSMKETMGMTEFSSPFQDSWRVQGLIQLGVRPRKTN
ncbi:tail terminator [Mycobacterium phage MyraDee]|uniref:Tail terminator n=1 Tax=Mycobacterium phage MyraDee TaxID=2024303 RepID=A0A222YZK7_9CAUD|nr:tail terminator [Mycobacterium phage MyraDee]ASR77127.1 tail terminator [Mycobacterium phage MyraDee]